MSVAANLCELSEKINAVRYRDWSLITGRGGYKTGGGPCKVLSLCKREGGKSFSHAEVGWGGGHNKFWGSFYMEG